MFDIIKDLKENIQKNNMKKLVLSAVLGMFCYCTNNAMEHKEKEEQIEIKNIYDVLNIMIDSQIKIFKAKENIKDYDKKIYSAIKGEEEKIKKKNVLVFIRSQFSSDEQKEKSFDDDINKIEQYFHLELKKENDECKDDNLTETFWTAPETKEKKQGAITEKEKEPIKQYFNTIIEAENNLSKAFKRYYEIKKEQNPEAQDEDILKEIMNDCCGEEKQDDKVTRFIENLENYWNAVTEEEGKIKNTILTTIRSRIYLGTETSEKEFIYFFKQKIGIEEKKEVECCPCCDCLEKKKNIEVIEV